MKVQDGRSPRPVPEMILALPDWYLKSCGIDEAHPGREFLCPCQYGVCQYCRFGQHARCATLAFKPTHCVTHIVHRDGHASLPVYGPGRQCVWRCDCCDRQEQLGQLELFAS